jgi:hypothetical protein
MHLAHDRLRLHIALVGERQLLLEAYRVIGGVHAVLAAADSAVPDRCTNQMPWRLAYDTGTLPDNAPRQEAVTDGKVIDLS